VWNSDAVFGDVRGQCPSVPPSCIPAANAISSIRRTVECAQPVTARIESKTAKNECQLFSLRSNLEKETTAGPPKVNTARLRSTRCSRSRIQENTRTRRLERQARLGRNLAGSNSGLEFRLFLTTAFAVGLWPLATVGGAGALWRPESQWGVQEGRPTFAASVEVVSMRLCCGNGVPVGLCSRT